ncbi:hypothetical protein MATL_G00122060 [Megalops atlanticus]|uniref:Uncharacterized protein n=1 Tax=Megalops atlanticus TaxID=7932 RepID=A0A9D3Q0F2_MEGAT|nr:hypothetical protein MATL_G00122060 [Megalops atlanticus]
MVSAGSMAVEDWTRTQASTMTDSIMSKAATMEIPINSNGDTGTLPEDDGLEQAAQIQWSLDEKDLQQVMVSGPNLNETSIVSGGLRRHH